MVIDFKDLEVAKSLFPNGSGSPLAKEGELVRKLSMLFAPVVVGAMYGYCTSAERVLVEEFNSLARQYCLHAKMLANAIDRKGTFDTDKINEFMACKQKLLEAYQNIINAVPTRFYYESFFGEVIMIAEGYLCDNHGMDTWEQLLQIHNEKESK